MDDFFDFNEEMDSTPVEPRPRKHKRSSPKFEYDVPGPVSNTSVTDETAVFPVVDESEINSVPENDYNNEENYMPKKKNLGARIGVSLLKVVFYFVLIIFLGIIASKLGWAWACDVLALGKDTHTAEIVLTDDMFKEETVTDEDGTSETVTIADMDAVTTMLKENGMIEYEFLFKLFGQFSHASTKIIPGSFTLSTDMDYRALISSMSSSSLSRVSITLAIPEGFTEKQIFQLLEDEGVAKVADLEEVAATHDYKFDFLDGIPMGDARRLEGFLYPDTYEFYLNHDPLYVINKFLCNFEEKYNKDLQARAEEYGFTPKDVVTLASLIEKETDGTDQRNLSSVLHNRLDGYATNGYLQLDSTVIYAMSYTSTPDKFDLEVDSPYNTYTHDGLPVGAICSPGMNAIYAALNPNDTDYIYFFTDVDSVNNYYTDFDEFIADYNLYGLDIEGAESRQDDTENETE